MGVNNDIFWSEMVAGFFFGFYYVSFTNRYASTRFFTIVLSRVRVLNSLARLSARFIQWRSRRV